MKKASLYILCGLLFVNINTWVCAVNIESFPTLRGLNRTVKEEFTEDDCASEVTTYVVQSINEVTIQGKQYLQFKERNMCLREADNKVYLYSGKGSEELVLYDYTLGVGEALRQIMLDEGSEYTFSYRPAEVQGAVMTVTQIEPVTLLDGKTYKKWTFDNGMEYVETIGSYGNSSMAGDFFQIVSRPIPTCLPRIHCVCISRNGQLLYEMPQEEQTRLHTYCMSSSLVDSYIEPNTAVSAYELKDGILTFQVPVASIRLYGISGVCLLQTTQPCIDLSSFGNQLCIMNIVLANGEQIETKIMVGDMQ
ncbi:MAG: hypothetical protein ACI30A_05255 [Paludibacteraceae bacterium]